MAISVELEPELEARLRERAASEDMSAAEYLVLLAERELGEGRPQSGAEAIEYWRKHDCLGLFADGPDSVELVQQWRRQEEARRDRFEPPAE